MGALNGACKYKLPLKLVWLEPFPATFRFFPLTTPYFSYVKHLKLYTI